MKNKTIEQCYQKSVELLFKNTNQYGLMAASLSEKAKDRRYVNIFGRDACICSLGMVASGDKRLIEIAKKSLLILVKYQSKLGQIPYSVNPAQKEVLFYYMGDKDSTLWWLIAVDFYNKHSGDKKLKKKLEINVKKALSWLLYQDQNNCGLLEQCEASDWADLMPSNGNVLYSNVLWYKVLEIYKFENEKKLANEGLNNLFFPFEADTNLNFFKKDSYRIKILDYLKTYTKKRPYYLNYISMFHGNERCDVFGNSLAILLGIADRKRSNNIINNIIKNKANKIYPIRVLFPIIEKSDPDYREYLNHRKLNIPYGYHNGGIWPFVGGFWVMALKKAGREKLAWQELVKLAEANKANDWQFNEYFHGVIGKPMGMPGQSWNAGTFLLAYHYLKGNIKL
jgi:glycogen debranching enzyme